MSINPVKRVLKLGGASASAAAGAAAAGGGSLLSSPDDFPPLTSSSSSASRAASSPAPLAWPNGGGRPQQLQPQQPGFQRFCLADVHLLDFLLMVQSTNVTSQVVGVDPAFPYTPLEAMKRRISSAPLPKEHKQVCLDYLLERVRNPSTTSGDYRIQQLVSLLPVSRFPYQRVRFQVLQRRHTSLMLLEVTLPWRRCPGAVCLGPATAA
jgi:hypothetical protein